LAEAAAQADDDAFDAAVADEQVRAETDIGDGHVRRKSFEKISEVRLVGGRIENLSRTADAKPSVVFERRIGREPPAQVRQARGQALQQFGAVHAAPPCCSSLVGSALIQSVMVPAPSPTTRSPSLA